MMTTMMLGTIEGLQDSEKVMSPWNERLLSSGVSRTEDPEPLLARSPSQSS